MKQKSVDAIRNEDKAKLKDVLEITKASLSHLRIYRIHEGVLYGVEWDGLYEEETTKLRYLAHKIAPWLVEIVRLRDE